MPLTDVLLVLDPARLASLPLNARHALFLDIQPLLLDNVHQPVVMESSLELKVVILEVHTLLVA